VSFAYHDDQDGASGPRPYAWRARPVRVLRRIIRYWALFGGLIVVGLVLLNTASAISNLFVDRPVPGDYELTKHFIAVAIFAFLPYCQISGANVTVDIFTEGMSERAKSAMVAFSSLFAIAFALLLMHQMWYGYIDYRFRYPETTATLHFPLWTAFPPALFSLVLLLIAGIVTAYEGWRGMRAAPSAP
jgi:TRAP-type C4-dicarboxylate transport system permease small subunit